MMYTSLLMIVASALKHDAVRVGWGPCSLVTCTSSDSGNDDASQRSPRLPTRCSHILTLISVVALGQQPSCRRDTKKLLLCDTNANPARSTFGRGAVTFRSSNSSSTPRACERPHFRHTTILHVYSRSWPRTPRNKAILQNRHLTGGLGGCC